MIKESTVGISKTFFVTGLIAAIIVSSALSAIIATQLAKDPQPSGFNTPDFDSGWMPISQKEAVELSHNLGTTDVFVYVYGRAGTFVHQLAVGGDTHALEDGYQHHGLVWHGLSNNSIIVERGLDDSFWEEFRVLIWVIS